MRSQYMKVSSQVTQVSRGYIAEETEVQLQSDHIGQMRSQYRRGRCPVRSHEVRRGQSAEKEEVQLQLDHREQTRSQYSIGRGPAWSHEVRQGHSTVYEEVQSGHTGQTRYNCRGDGVSAPSDHRRQTRSQYRRGRCPVRSHEVRRGQSAE